MPFGDLKNDYLFHHIFGEHPNLTVALLNDILGRSGPSLIVSLEMLPPEQRPPLAGAKLSILDLKARDQAGNMFVVEVQVLPMAGFVNRVVFNACRAHDGQLKQGQGYVDLAPVIALSLCDFELWPDEQQDAAGQARVPLVSKWRVTERLGANNGLEQVQYAFVELPKVKSDRPLETEAERWAWLFKSGSQLSALPEGLSQAQREAMKMADRATWTQAEQDAYRKAFDEVEQARQLAREGEVRGEARGRADGLREGEARGLRAAIEVACELLGITLADEQRRALSALDTPALARALDHIKRARRFPD